MTRTTHLAAGLVSLIAAGAPLAAQQHPAAKPMAVAAQPVPDKALDAAPAWQYAVTVKGMKGAPMQAMAAHAIRYEVTSPRDQASGQASGKRMHKPFVITKELDAASPRLVQAMSSGEVIPEVLIDVKPTDRTSARGPHTIRLLDVTVSSVTPVAGAPRRQEIAFSFQRIEVDGKMGKTMAMDDWR